MVCIRCQKRPAIIFIQRMENGQMKQEGYCLHCARELHIKPVDDLMKQFGMSEQDLDNMENRMESMMEELGDSNPLSMLMNMSGSGEDADAENMDEDLVPGSNATFPLGFTSSEKQDGDKKGSDRKNGKKPPKRKFLDTYCENLTRKAREGKLDDIIGRDREIYRTPSGIRPDSRSYTGPTPRLSYPLSQPPPLPPDCTCVCPCSQLCYYCTLRSWMTSLTIRRSHFSVLFLTGKKTSSSRVIHQGLEKNYIYHFMYI